LKDRIDIGDWWALRNMPNGFVAHNDRNRCLTMTPWKNPHPDKVIESIVMESTGKAIPILLGITAADSLNEREVLKKILE
jgi:hypothetical protein